MKEPYTDEGWVLIPSKIAKSDRLSGIKKILWGKIHALQSETGYCYASNEYLAEQIGASKRTVRRHIEDLEERNFVERFTDKKGKRRLKTVMTPGQKVPPRTDVSGGGGQMCPGGRTDVSGPSYSIVEQDSKQDKNNKGGEKDDTPPVDNSTPSSSGEEKFDEWWEYYCDTFEGLYEPRKKTQKRKQRFKRRLETYSLEEIKEATDKIRQSPFHCGDNDRNKFYAKPEFILRNDEKIEEWLNHDPQGNTVTNENGLGPEVERARQRVADAFSEDTDED